MLGAASITFPYVVDPNAGLDYMVGTMQSPSYPMNTFDLSINQLPVTGNLPNLNYYSQSYLQSQLPLSEQIKSPAVLIGIGILALVLLRV